MLNNRYALVVIIIALCFVPANYAQLLGHEPAISSCRASALLNSIEAIDAGATTSAERFGVHWRAPPATLLAKALAGVDEPARKTPSRDRGERKTVKKSPPNHHNGNSSQRGAGISKSSAIKVGQLSELLREPVHPDGHPREPVKDRLRHAYYDFRHRGAHSFAA